MLMLTHFLSIGYFFFWLSDAANKISEAQLQIIIAKSNSFSFKQTFIEASTYADFELPMPAVQNVVIRYK